MARLPIADLSDPLLAVENGGAGRPNLVALVGEAFASDGGCVAEERAGAMPVGSAGPSSTFRVLEPVPLPVECGKRKRRFFTVNPMRSPVLSRDAKIRRNTAALEPFRFTVLL